MNEIIERDILFELGILEKEYDKEIFINDKLFDELYWQEFRCYIIF